MPEYFVHLYRNIKPSMTAMNLLAFLGGYVFAAKMPVPSLHLLITLAGIGMVIASACALNNYIDRHIDGQMTRTHK